jgi:hypothetical protein
MINSMYIIKESNELAYTKSVLLTFFENFTFPLSGKLARRKVSVPSTLVSACT